MSNSLDPDKDGCSVGPDLSPNCCRRQEEEFSKPCSRQALFCEMNIKMNS